MSLTSPEPTAVPVGVTRVINTAADQTGEPGQPRGTGIAIRWSTGAESTLPSRLLRERCPCATCLSKRGDSSHDRPLTGGRAMLSVVRATADDELDLRSVWAVGNYALGIQWGDGHDSGIYSYALLSELAKTVDAAKPAAGRAG